MLSCQDTVQLQEPPAKIRFFSRAEAQELGQTVRKRNVFARHSWENNFYLGRIQSLADTSIIEVFLPGQPDDIIPQAQVIADVLEKLVLLSTTFVTKRDKLQQQLAISRHRRSVFDITIGPGYQYLRSKSKREFEVNPVVLDEKLSKRFERCGFRQLGSACASSEGLPSRIRSAIDWLFESRLEPALPAAIVKTAIALESMLIFDQSEPLARSLSERIAFIVSQDPSTRQQISALFKKFYDARSGVVHGSRKGPKGPSPGLLEGIDRITLLVCLTIGSNRNLWHSTQTLLDWCEGQKWGTPDTTVNIPFPSSLLSQAMDMCVGG